MMSEGDTAKVASRYKSWDTEDLVRASSLEAQEYTPEAISLMRKELRKRDLTPEAQEAVQERVVEKAHEQQRSLVGLKGWLRVFVVIFALNFGAVLASNILAVNQSLPQPLKLVVVLEILVGVYALGTLWLLVARHEKAPQHAKTVLVIFCFLELGSWLVFYWRGLALGPFPLGALSLTWIGWSYLSYSERVRCTYGPRDELAAEAGLAQ